MSDTGHALRGRELNLSKWDLLIRNIWNQVRKERLWSAEGETGGGVQAGLSLWAWVWEVSSGLKCVLSRVPAAYSLKNIGTLPSENDHGPG